MKNIIAISDIHGHLPKIDECDILLIAGDIFPVDIQRKTSLCEEWLRTEFANWAKEIPAKYIVVVAGNHDFFFERTSSAYAENIFIESGISDKVFYLENSSAILDGIKIYGCPYCKGPYGWAFSPSDTNTEIEKKYDEIEDCDILLCHQPPMVKKVGCSYPGTPIERNFGSEYLADVISKRNIKNVVCGHIHTGTHGGVDFNGTTIYNVSMKDEDYYVRYSPTKITIDL